MMDDVLTGAAASATLRKLEYSLGTAFQSGFMDGFIDEFSGVEEALKMQAPQNVQAKRWEPQWPYCWSNGEAIRLITEFEKPLKLVPPFWAVLRVKMFRLNSCLKLKGN